MILGFLSNSLSTGPKLLGVESGSNSPDLPGQLLLDTTFTQNAPDSTAFLLPVIDLRSVLFCTSLGILECFLWASLFHLYLTISNNQ